ncbi:MAG TPA: DEAD/DEAH box helicase [Vicinamibacterales bacterium]|nr:DEAD/DEAH box helicase [Vicinamibacterales bacterium]
MPLSHFHPVVARWFSEALGEPTAAQRAGWASIRRGAHTLIAAPTGSGKTLAAFLTAIDDLVKQADNGPLADAVQVLYVSPLKALSADIHKNLAEPRLAIERLAAEAGMAPPSITAAVRTGDTTSSERAAMIRRPPHILVTTPESLYLLLTAEQSRAMLRSVKVVIVDEIHAVIGTRRGAHLALSLERLDHVAGRPLQRIGLSATQKPIEEVARYLVGTAARDCTIVDEGHRRSTDLGLELPGSSLEAVMSHEIWEDCYNRLAALILEHRTTIVFVNTRRLAERIARHLSDRLGGDAVTAHHGSLSKETRLDAENRLKQGALKALVATASLELGIDIGHVDLVCQIGSPRRIATLLQRVGRSGHSISGTPKGRLFPMSRDDLIECTALLRSVERGDLDRIVLHEAPLDVLAQQIVAETACEEYGEDDLFDLIRGAWPYRELARSDFDAVVAMTADGFATRRGRRSALVHRDEVNRRLRGRRGARLLAISSGGAIPEVADYRVVLEPDDLFIGTLNEDFAIESMAGDIFQLGNASWQVLQVGPGVVRVADAKGAPPNIPFWIGEAPARSDELSEAVSRLRTEVDERLSAGLEPTIEWLEREGGISRDAAEQAVQYLADGRQALGAMPSQDTLVLERFFDESGGMQLVLHAPFGSRVNKAWGLALRKRFCRQFNFELQAAATDDALLLSLGPQHSFPLADVFRYLHPATARDVLIQAFLDAPVFQTRWRWNTTVALAVPRRRNGKKVAPQLQRMLADDLLAAVFPDAAACLENIPGDREIPDHPLVSQTVRDCLTEAMDFDRLAAILTRIHNGEIRMTSRDTVEPSPFSHEILNARPYAFLDDAPLEERRTQAVYARRAGEPGADATYGALDGDAIVRVVDEQRIDARDANELHDALLTTGYLTKDEIAAVPSVFLDALTSSKRAALASMDAPGGGALEIVVAAERLPELLAVHGTVRLAPSIEAPATRIGRSWTRESALIELLRGRLSFVGPATTRQIAQTIAVVEADVEAALLALESEGAILRGLFLPKPPDSSLQWCDRRLLARIHRYTLNRLRAEIEPVSVADFMRFLFSWQHLSPDSRLSGLDGLRAIVAQLDGLDAAAAAWERVLLPARMDRYEPAMLDSLCLGGEVQWTGGYRRALSTENEPRPPVNATPIALVASEHAATWRSLATDSPVASREARPPIDSELTTQPMLGETAALVLETLRSRGALFVRELVSLLRLQPGEVRTALSRLVGAGLATSDGFAGLRTILGSNPAAPNGVTGAEGRWSAVRDQLTSDADRSAAIDVYARVLLTRYGVVFRRLLDREPGFATWRELTRVYRRLEARGEIRGGRFVTGMSGEHFALPEAVERLREIRRTSAAGQLVAITAVDPLNLTGVIDAGDRIRASMGTRIVYRDGIAAAVMEGDYVRTLTDIPPAQAGDIASVLAGRRVPPVLSGYVGRTG